LTQAAKLAFPLRTFLGQDVVLVRAAMLIAVRGAPETLRRAAIGFQFRHYKYSALIDLRSAQLHVPLQE
jgi:hypothetical protein